MTPPETQNLRVYFWTTGLATLLVLTAIVTTNYIVDPYLIHQWDTELIHRPSPAQQKIMPWAKTYAVYRYRPEVVYLGSSRTEIGLPTASPLFAGKRVFNLAISGASLGDAVNMLRHTSAAQRPDTVVWGIDYGWQFREKTGNTDFTDSLVAKGPFYPVWRTLLNMKRSVSTSMTGETIKILFGTAEQKCQSLLATYGQKSAPCLEHIMRDEGGTAKAFEEVLKKREPQASPADVPATVELLDRVTAEYCQMGTVFRLYLQPIHALAELSYWATAWDDLDDWKKSLVGVIDVRRQQGCDVRLVDFSGFNRITTEEIPQATGRETMQHYWEQSHYRSEVGQQILERLFTEESQEDKDDFGIELTGETIEKHLLDSRRKRQEYIARHPQETAHMTL